jgi:hypothetical protein
MVREFQPWAPKEIPIAATNNTTATFEMLSVFLVLSTTFSSYSLALRNHITEHNMTTAHEVRVPSLAKVS